MEEADGHLKKVKGRTLPLMVPTNVTAGELLKQQLQNTEDISSSLTHWKITSCSISTKLL